MAGLIVSVGVYYLETGQHNKSIQILLETEALESAPAVLSQLVDLLDAMPGWEWRETSDSVQWWSRIY